MPAKNVGILSMADMLKMRQVSAVQVGLDTIGASLAADLAVHNRLLQDALGYLAQNTADRRRRYGISGVLEFQEADEFTRSHTQKVITGSVVEFPLKAFQASIGWTAQFFRNKSVADLAATQVAAKAGHVQSILSALKRAVYGASNYVWNDYRVDGIDLQVRRFLNADGEAIPMGPNGEIFDPLTHSHYLFSNGLTNAAAIALVSTVVEHHQDGQPIVFINTADEAAWRALADFKPYIDSRLSIPTASSTPLTRLNPFRANDRAIGLFGAAEVWVKPWALSNYAFCTDTRSELKPLVIRTRSGSGPVLDTVGTNVLFPQQAEYMESEYGVGTWTRTNGAVLYHAGGAVAYVSPVINGQAS
jgi:hypothetical protein